MVRYAHEAGLSVFSDDGTLDEEATIERVRQRVSQEKVEQE